MTLDLTSDKLAIVTPAGKATYDYAGDCQQPECAKRLFVCTSHPIRADEAIGAHIAVFVAGAPNEPPVTYCAAHDPHRGHRAKRRPVAVDDQGREVMIGDAWQPTGGWTPGA